MSRASRARKRADRIAALAEQLGLLSAGLEGNPDLASMTAQMTPVSARPASPRVPFRNPDPFKEPAYPNTIRAKPRALAPNFCCHNQHVRCGAVLDPS